MTETALVRAILDRLALEPGVLAMRNSVGSRGIRKFGLGEGSADIICCAWGDFVALEVKLPGETLRPPQERWRNSVLRAGGLCLKVTSVAEAVEEVRKVRAYQR